MDQQQFISYWTTETGWRTELQLRNNQVGHILTVTPVLRAADGSETSLFPILVQPRELKTIDLETAIGTLAPQLIGTYGSLALRYRAPNQINLYAVAMIMGVGHSLAFHIDSTGEDQTESAGSREGIWWLPDSTVKDYLVLTNQGQNPLQANLSVFDAGGNSSTQPITLAPRAMSRLSIREIIKVAGLTGSYGGIKVAASAHAGSLDTLHIVFDPAGGFSAVMKMFFHDPRAQLAERDYSGSGVWTVRAPMLALSNPDPALGFPAGTTLRPQLFIHNTTARITKLNFFVNWHSDSADGQAAPITLQLGPFETRHIDVASLPSSKAIPADAHWASVTLTTDGLPDEIVAVAASYDSSRHYGAQTPFSDQLAAHWEGSQWQYDPQHDSIITVGNGGSKPALAAFTLFYNQGTQKYEMDQTLQPGQQMWIDIGKLIRENVPGKNGTTLPANLTTGSYEIADLTNKFVGTLFEGKVIYDKTYGHVTYGCALCCGYSSPMPLWYDPIDVIIEGLQDDGVFAWYPCESEYDDVSTAFYNGWSSGAPSIVTVDSYGTHHGVSIGSTTSDTFGVLQSNNVHLYCPTHGFSPSGGANVTPSISLSTPLWFFGTGVPTPSGFTLGATNATLTASGGGNGTYVWTITGGTLQVVLENGSTTITKTNVNTVGISSTFESTQADDVKVQLQYTAAGTSQALTTSLSFSVDSPYKLTSTQQPLDVGLRLGSTCQTMTSGSDGYASGIPYNIISFFGVQITNVYVNETFGSRSDGTSNKWPSPTAGSYTSTNGTFADCLLAVGPSWTPPTLPPQSPLLSQDIFDILQTWYVGSLTNGSGLPVQFDDPTYYQDHGRHVSVSSPVR